MYAGSVCMKEVGDTEPTLHNGGALDFFRFAKTMVFRSICRRWDRRQLEQSFGVVEYAGDSRDEVRERLGGIADIAD